MRKCIEAFARHDSEDLRIRHSIMQMTQTPARGQCYDWIGYRRWRAGDVLPWDSQVIGCASGFCWGVMDRGLLRRTASPTGDGPKYACIADAEDHGVRFLSVRLPEGAIAALHAVEAVGFRIIESFLTFGRKTDW